MVVAANDGELVARLHFEAEHTNVLVVSVELLNGCLASTEIETMTAKVVNPHIPEFPVSKKKPRKRKGLSSKRSLRLFSAARKRKGFPELYACRMKSNMPKKRTRQFSKTRPWGLLPDSPGGVTA